MKISAGHNFRYSNSGSIVDWGTILEAGRLRVRDSMMSMLFFIYLSTYPGVYSAEMSTGRRKQMSLWSKARPARKTDNFTDICHDWLDKVGSSTSQNPIGLDGLLIASFLFLIPTELHSATNNKT
jgi:hypothetical protein